MDIKQLFDLIQKNIKGYVPPLVFDDVRTIIETKGLTVELAEEVFRQSIYREARNPLNYFMSTLKRLSKAGVKTLEDFEDYNSTFQSEKQQRSQNWKNPTNGRLPASQVPPLPPNVKGGF